MMLQDCLDDLGPCDSVYVVPHALDLALSCGGRLLHESRQGLKVLVISLFGPGLDGPFEPAGGPEERAARALTALGVSHCAVNMPEARRRSALYSSYTGLLEARDVADEAWAGQTAEMLTDVAHRTRAKQVYVPLAVGGHIDHQLAHEASRAAFPAEGRNVFLYEDRPEALVAGAVRIRLAQMGARLPPAADVAEPARALSYLMRFHVAPEFRGELAGWEERLRAARTAARHWRAGRAWNPQRAWGPRLQPVVYPTDAADLPGVNELSASLADGGLGALAQRYSARLGGAVHAERYWLLLPARETDGLETLPPSAAASIRAQLKGRLVS
jgi:LmbE family N-acetylglucosaminyl deacetylase